MKECWFSIHLSFLILNPELLFVISHWHKFSLWLMSWIFWEKELPKNDVIKHVKNMLNWDLIFQDNLFCIIKSFQPVKTLKMTLKMWWKHMQSAFWFHAKCVMWSFEFTLNLMFRSELWRLLLNRPYIWFLIPSQVKRPTCLRTLTISKWPSRIQKKVPGQSRQRWTLTRFWNRQIFLLSLSFEYLFLFQ